MAFSPMPQLLALVPKLLALVPTIRLRPIGYSVGAATRAFAMDHKCESQVGTPVLQVMASQAPFPTPAELSVKVSAHFWSLRNCETGCDIRE